MFEWVKIKTLLFGMLVASPAVVYWSGGLAPLSAARPSASSGERLGTTQPAAKSVVKIPVEVIATGSAPKWIYVQVGN